MADLDEVVGALAERADVDAVVLLSGDGLPIRHAGRRLPDPESVAALGATCVRHAAAFNEALGRGTLETAVLEAPDGLAILARVGVGDWLAVLPAPEADAGTLLYDLRRHRPALTALL